MTTARRRNCCLMVGNVVGMSSMSDVTRKRITKTLSSSHDEIDTFWDLLWMDLTSTFQ